MSSEIYVAADAAWNAKAQGIVENADMRCFIIHMHQPLDADAGAAPKR